MSRWLMTVSAVILTGCGVWGGLVFVSGESGISLAAAGGDAQADHADLSPWERALGEDANADGLRDAVSDYLDAEYQGELRLYGKRIASHLQGVMLASLQDESSIPYWESLVQEVACANNRHGAKAVNMYAWLRDRIINTEYRRTLYEASQQEIARHGDREILTAAQAQVATCPTVGNLPATEKMSR